MTKRIWMDGCFDLFHYGHANALRQANELGNEVVCGINSFEEILKNKGLPVFSDEEREEIVSSCRWIKETVLKVPYTPSIELIKQFKCDYAVHGDDPALDKNGVDVYANPKAMGIYKEVGRTPQISTTEIVGRLMLQEKNCLNSSCGYVNHNDFYDKLLKSFKLPPKQKSGNVIFIDGIFDLYHAGHCRALKNAKKNGDFLIVGILSDNLTKKYTGISPVMNEKERLLVLHSNRYIDEIVLSPFEINLDFIQKHKIDKILCSYDIKDMSRLKQVKGHVIQDFHKNPFGNLSTDNIVNRIISNYQLFASRQNAKNQNN